jgi:hypothetical protein
MKPTDITRTPLKLERVLFVYAKPTDGEVLCLWHEEALAQGIQLLAAGWKHTATISPEKWIPALLAATPDDASDMMDELNFGACPSDSRRNESQRTLTRNT